MSLLRIPSVLRELPSLIGASPALDGAEKAYLLKAKRGAQFRVSKLFIIISRVCWGELIQSRSRDRHKHWVNLNTRSLENACRSRNGELKTLIASLQKLGVLEINPRYSAGRFSRSYCFAPAYRRQTPVPCPANISLSKAQRRGFADGLAKDIKVGTDLERWLYGNLCRLRFHENVRAYVEQREYRGDNRDHSKAHAEMLIEAINADIKGGEVMLPGWFFSRENRVGRLFTPIISLHKDLRAFLRLDGQKLWEIDQHASQPFLLLKFYQVMDGADGAAVQAEAQSYYGLWQGGDFYGAFVRLTGAAITADAMKQCLIKGALNCRNVKQPPTGVDRAVAKAILDAFKRHFPLLAAAIDRLKTVRDVSIAAKLKPNTKGGEKLHSQFGIRLQQIESEIFIDGIAAELMQRGIFCYTAHDAVGCLEKDVGAVTEVMERQLSAAIGFRPILKASRPKAQAGLQNLDA